jgi:hypothetical protein
MGAHGKQNPPLSQTAAAVGPRRFGFNNPTPQTWPRLAGAGQILSAVPTIDWVLLGSGKSNKVQELGSLYLQIVSRTHLASFGRNACNNNNKTRR